MERPSEEDRLFWSLSKQKIYLDALRCVARPIDPLTLTMGEAREAVQTALTIHEFSRDSGRALANFVLWFINRTQHLQNSYDKFAGVSKPWLRGFDGEKYIKDMARLQLWLEMLGFVHINGYVEDLLTGHSTLDITIEGKFLLDRFKLVRHWTRAMVNIDAKSLEDVQTLTVGALGTRYALLQIVQIAEGCSVQIRHTTTEEAIESNSARLNGLLARIEERFVVNEAGTSISSRRSQISPVPGLMHISEETLVDEYDFENMASLPRAERLPFLIAEDFSYAAPQSQNGAAVSSVRAGVRLPRNLARRASNLPRRRRGATANETSVAQRWS